MKYSTLPQPFRSITLNRRLFLACACAFSVLSPSYLLAQNYPDKPVKLTVGFAPGTGPDTVARFISQKMSDHLKQQVVVDNRTGAGGQIAVQTFAKSAPDGYNLLLAEVGSIAIAPSAFSKLPYDPLRDLIPISEVARADFLLLVPAQSPHKTLEEFVRAAKAQSGGVNFGTFGAATPGHFGAELFAAHGGFKIVPIHYRATGDAITGIVGGDVQGAFVTTALGSAQVKGGKMRALATTASARSKLLPDVPTFTEAGMPKVEFSSWLAFFVPAGTPPAIVQTLHQAIVASARDAEVIGKLEDTGFRVLGTSPAETEKMVRSELQRWSGIVKAIGFKGSN